VIYPQLHFGYLKVSLCDLENVLLSEQILRVTIVRLGDRRDISLPYHKGDQYTDLRGTLKHIVCFELEWNGNCKPLLLCKEEW
jgi:hypothetical protein